METYKYIFDTVVIFIMSLLSLHAMRRNTAALRENTLAVSMSGSLSKANPTMPDAMDSKQNKTTTHETTKYIPLSVRYSFVMPIAVLLALTFSTLTGSEVTGLKLFVACIYSVLLAFTSIFSALVHLVFIPLYHMESKHNESGQQDSGR